MASYLSMFLRLYLHWRQCEITILTVWNESNSYLDKIY